MQRITRKRIQRARSVRQVPVRTQHPEVLAQQQFETTLFNLLTGMQELGEKLVLDFPHSYIVHGERTFRDGTSIFENRVDITQVYTGHYGFEKFFAFMRSMWAYQLDHAPYTAGKRRIDDDASYAHGKDMFITELKESFRAFHWSVFLFYRSVDVVVQFILRHQDALRAADRQFYFALVYSRLSIFQLLTFFYWVLADVEQTQPKTYLAELKQAGFFEVLFRDHTKSLMNRKFDVQFFEEMCTRAQA